MVEGQIIAGIGNEVFFSVGAVTCVTLLLGLILFNFRSLWTRNSGLHELSQEAVNSVRDHLGHFSNRFGSSEAVNGQNRRTMDVQHFGPDNQCPICLIEPQNPVETNCGHLFCSQCIIIYWRHGTWRGTIRCPVCRQQVTVLLRCFRDRDNPEMEREINDYNRRFSGEPRPWIDYLRDLPILLRHLGSEFFSMGGLMYMFRLRIVLCFLAALMYLISPLDMIPEAVFGILGLLDDLFVVLLLAIYVTVVYRRFLAGRWQEDS